MSHFETVIRRPVAVAVLIVLLSACGLGGQPASSPDATATATQTAEPTAEPTAKSTTDGLELASFVFRQGAEGRPLITVTIPAAGWYGESGRGIVIKNDNGDPPDGAGLIGPFHSELLIPEDPCQWQSTMPDSPATTVDEVIAALQHQSSRNASQPMDITVDGYSGKSLTLHVPDDLAYNDGFSGCELATFCTMSVSGDPETECGRYSQGPGQIEEVWVLDVDGMVVASVGMYFPGTPAEHVDELRSLLGSMTFGE